MSLHIADLSVARVSPRRAFTLIELLTVIAIIGVLAAIVIVTTGKVMQSARRSKCLNNLRQIGTGTMLYVADNKGKYPSGIWDTLVLPYLGGVNQLAGSEVLKCPEDPRPLALATGGFARSYAFSAMNGARPNDGIIRNLGTFRNIAQLSRPPRTIMMFESFTNSAGTAIDNRQFSSSFIYADGWLGAGGIPKIDGQASFYHGSVMNFCFADGHVESMAPTKAYSPANLWQAVE